MNNSHGLLVLGDAYNLPFRDSSIDGLFFSHVIEHLETPFPILAEIYRVLKENGICVIITPTEHRYFYTPGHVHAYSKKELQTVLTKAGFLVVKIAYGYSYIFNTKDSEFLRRAINLVPIRWFKEILVAIAVKATS